MIFYHVYAGPERMHAKWFNVSASALTYANQLWKDLDQKTDVTVLYIRLYDAKKYQIVNLLNYKLDDISTELYWQNGKRA